MKTYKDIYVFPLVSDNMISWVYDSNRNFVFQFMIDNDDKENLLLSVINGKTTLGNKDLVFKHENGEIKDHKDQSIILIRGWGNLTGIGAHNLPEEEAANIQDTFAEYIVEQLNKR